jgi:hypothetical protein
MEVADVVVQKRETENGQIMENILKFKEEFPKTKLWILTPCYAGQCFVTYMNSLIGTIKLFEKIGIELVVEYCRNDSLICRARNNMVARALTDPKMTHILFIDSDISWNPLDILKLILSRKEMVGGVYPLKKWNWEKLVSSSGRGLTELIDKKEKSVVKDVVSAEEYIKHNLLDYNVNFLNSKMVIVNSLTEVKHIPTGFMMIKREVFTKMMYCFPSTKYVDDVRYLTVEENVNAFALFDCGVVDGHYYSEDWMFCHRWQKVGGSIWMDVSISLTHSGVEDFTGFILSTIL